MASSPKELKDILFDLSDPKLNLISEASFCVGAVPVEEKVKARGGVDLFKPKLYDGTGGGVPLN